MSEFKLAKDNTFVNRMVRAETLKPCPFCGSEAEVNSWCIKGIANRTHYRVRCKYCGCECRTREYRKRKKAIDVWNRRV